MSEDIPEGYGYAPSPSAFPNHVGRLFSRKAAADDGTVEHWFALRVEDRHVNAWGMAHGGLIAFLAEVGVSAAGWEPGGPPVVAIEVGVKFLAAPKQGQLIEVRGRATRRTRSLVFAEVHAFVEGQLVFTASGINKVIGQ